jgi:hypothetical protein
LLRWRCANHGTRTEKRNDHIGKVAYRGGGFVLHVGRLGGPTGGNYKTRVKTSDVAR